MFRRNLDKASLSNKRFRKILYTGDHMQVVVMSLKPSQEIGMEKHNDVSQFLKITEGKVRGVVGNKKYTLGKGDAVIVPPGVYHNFINILKRKSSKLYTIYSPPEHH